MRRCRTAPFPASSPNLSSSIRAESVSMVEDYLRQSALAHLSLAAIARPERSDKEGVALKECPFRTVITWRGQAGETAFVAVVERNYGLRLPLRGGVVSGHPEGRRMRVRRAAE